MKLVKCAFIFLGMLFLQACSQTPTPNFQKMTLPTTPNYYLVCPQGYCNTTPNAYSPVYPISADDLFNAFNQMVAKEPRVNFIYSIPEQGEFVLIQRSLFFHFPDQIAVQFIALSDNTSTLAIYSKSLYGFYDFGANKRRVDDWLMKLNQTISTNATKS